MNLDYETSHNEAVREAWLNFIHGRPVRKGSIRPEILESWKRCKAYGTDPFLNAFPVGDYKKIHKFSSKDDALELLPRKLSKTQLAERIAQNSALVTATRNVLKNFYQYINSMDVVLFLTDKDGYLIERMGEGPLYEYYISMSHDNLGASMHEAFKGTIAPSMALFLDTPYEMAAEEHYMELYHRCHCVAAPIHDVSNRVIGCLDMTFARNTTLKQPHTLTMIIALAGTIENQLQLMRAMEETDFISRSLKSAMTSMNDGLIVIGMDNKIVHINTMAEKLLDVKLNNVLNQSIINIIRNKKIIAAYEKREQMIEQEIVLEEFANRPRCMVSINFICNAVGKHVGSTIFLKEYRQIQRLVQKVAGPKAHYTFDDLLGRSPGIKRVIQVAKTVASSTSNVIISGESGTGKELIAQSIHNAGCYADGPFIAINCAAIPYDLIESEIFGYEAGTFTGGLRQGKPGKLELAKGGTLFLDEINGMSMDMQTKLLRVLEERTFQRLGSTNNFIRLDARIISATNQDLLKRIEHGNFRGDLYYRLSVIDIVIPPLRERKDDIEILVKTFIDEKNRQLGRNIKGVSKDALDYLKSYPWPGNVRELKNWIEKAVNLAEGEALRREDFPSFHAISGSSHEALTLSVQNDVKEDALHAVDLFERDVIKTVLKECGGNILQTAKRLGIGRATLYRKMDKYEISLSKNVLS